MTMAPKPPIDPDKLYHQLCIVLVVCSVLFFLSILYVCHETGLVR